MMKTLDTKNIWLMTLAIASIGIGGTGCSFGGGASQTIVKTVPFTGTPSSSQICSTIAGCVTTATGYKFPDGEGGFIVCANGSCTDQNNGMSTNTAAGYGTGQSAGTAAGYNAGYDVGQSAGYAAGYAAGQSNGNPNAYSNGYNSGYSSGVTDGQTSASNASYNAGYDDGESAGYKSGYTAGHYGGGTYSEGYGDGSDSGDYDGYNDGYDSGYDSGYDDGYSAGYSVGVHGVGGATKDVDLQKAQVQQASVTDKAQAIAEQFDMSLESATKLTQLADKVQKMTIQGQMTAEDRAAVTDSALSIAGLTPEQVNEAAVRSIRGDDSAADALMEKAAANLGMSNAANLRDKLLPALGIQTN